MRSHRKKGAVGNTTFYSTGHAGPASRSSDVAVQPKTFVDVSSHNGSISVNDYRTLANKGVGGVVVKLTEGTTYRNPYAGEQARNAQLAGLQVSAYAFHIILVKSRQEQKLVTLSQKLEILIFQRIRSWLMIWKMLK